MCYIRCYSVLFKIIEARPKFPKDTVKRVSMAYLNLLSGLKDDIAAESLDLEKLSDKVRKLRNLSATDEKVHKSLGSSSPFLQDIRKLIERLLAMPSSDDQIVCLRLCAQFIGNLTVGNPINQRNVHTQCFEAVKKLMVMGDGKLSLYCSMLLYNSLLGSPEIRDDILADPNIIKEILKEESEFASFIYEELLLKHGELEKLYKYANNDQRLMLLSTVKDNKNKENLKEETIKFIIERFKRQSDKILKIVTEYLHDIQPLEICLMLETLASLSGEPQYLKILQSDKSLFINCAFLLRSVHEAGKAGDNCFTSIQRLTAGLPNEKLKDNPAFAFKVDLVRLLGNLCWKNKELQDQIRELECIPILLDCCNIDEKNPFITQWSILAIRNLCEKNQENQAIIAGLSQKGVVSSPVLTELGYTLHSEEGKDIKLVPLQR